MDKTNTVYLEYALGDYPAVSHYMRALRERHFNVMTEPKLDTPYILVIMFSAQYVLANATFGSADPHRRPSRPPERIVVVRLDATRLPPYLSIHDTIFAANMTSFMSFDAIIDTLAKVLRSESISEDGFDTGAPNAASTVESAPTTLPRAEYSLATIILMMKTLSRLASRATWKLPVRMCGWIMNRSCRMTSSTNSMRGLLGGDGWF
jgi:hypothetical protein